jgi:ribonuclease P protein component
MSYDTDSDRSLSKEEILRGYDSFKNVFRKSKIIETRYLKCYIQFEDENSSPQAIKVGFTVSKKKAKKAYVRNRIKRLLREAYRNEKNGLTVRRNTVLIYSISDTKNNSIDNLYRNGFRLFTDDMKEINEKIKMMDAKR